MYPGERASLTPEKVAYVVEPAGVAVTYRELDEESNRIAHLFRDLGLRPGDAVAILMENHPAYLKVVWAAQRSGLRYTAVSTSLTAGEAAYIVDDCDAKVFVVSERFADVAKAMVRETPRVAHRFMVDGTAEAHGSLEERMRQYPTEPIPDECEGADMLYSSGTTGRPKGVKPEIENEEIGNPPPFVALMTLLWEFDEHAVYLSPAPMYHAAPMRFVVSVTRLGGTAVILERFDPRLALEAIERHGVTHAQFVPTHFVRMLKLPEEERRAFDTSSLRVAIHAAAPCPVEVKQRMMDWWGPIVHEYYGGTEGNGVCAVTPEEWFEHRGSVGRALLGEARVWDEEEGRELPPGEVGTIYFADGPDFEYHKDPEKTKAAYNEMGWSTMGDVGYVDEDGYVYLTDRKDNVIVTGGVNVYPQEAENVLTMHPEVADVAVFGVPNPEYGEEVKAVVQPRDPSAAGPGTERELLGYCRDRLAKVKCPRSVDFREELPRTETGKLKKRLLRDEYWATAKR